MDKNEVARLKERLRTDYERKLQAIELVEEMLAEATPAQPHVPHDSPEQPPVVVPVGGGDTDTIDNRIEALFRQHPEKRWTVPILAAQLEISNRSTVWGALQRLIKAGRAKQAVVGKGRRAAQYVGSFGENGKIVPVMN
jgi:hypothetical protein